MAAKKLIWIALYWVNWAVIFGFWLYNNYSLFGNNGTASVLIALGRLCGLSAAYLILVQFFLMGRNPLLERVFGLDTLARIHKDNGWRVLFFVLFHPILLLIGYSMLAKLSLIGQFNVFTANGYIQLAIIAFGIFTVIAGTAWSIVRLRLRYEFWYYIHILVYAAVGLTFLHQINLGEDINASRLFYGYWIAMYLIVFASFILYRHIRPWYRYFKFRFHVERVERESPTVTSIYISGRNLEKFSIEPGQFMIFRFLRKGMWYQGHPFSLSRPTDGKYIRLSVRELGDFTREVKNIEVGTKVVIDGPYGVFTNRSSNSNKVLLIAGGIGITPLRSLLEEMMQKGKDVVLVYGNRNQEEIVFRKEIESLGARAIHILSEDQKWTGEKGYVDSEKIKRLVPDYLGREIFLCGPPVMMDKLMASLPTIGVLPAQIRFERFAL